MSAIAQIALTPSGVFFALARSIGASDDEIAALAEGTLEGQRAAEIRVAMQCCCHKLAAVGHEYAGHC